MVGPRPFFCSPNFREILPGTSVNRPFRSGLFPKTLTRRGRQPCKPSSNIHPQGEVCVGFRNHSRPAAHEVLGTRSTAKATATNKATSTSTTNLIVVRGIVTFPFAGRYFGEAFLPRGGQVADRVADPSLRGGQVAVLRPHVASSGHVTNTAYSRRAGQRITQMSDLCIKRY